MMVRLCQNCEHCYPIISGGQEKLSCYNNINETKIVSPGNICEDHVYDGSLNFYTHVLYDKKYLGAPGFTIVSEDDRGLVKYAKIYRSDPACPDFNVCVYEKRSAPIRKSEWRTISFLVKNDDVLYQTFKSLSDNLNGRLLHSINPFQGGNYMSAYSDSEAAVVSFNQDVNTARELGIPTDSTININFGNFSLCPEDKWQAMSEFYKDLGNNAFNTSERSIAMIRTLSK